MIEDILPRKTVIADGVLSEVAFDFEVVNAECIKVYLNGVLQNSGWSLSDNKIIFTSAPSVNTTITVIRDLPINYLSPIKSRGALTSNKIDEHLSEMTAKVQTLSEKISRTPTYPVDTLLTGEQIAKDFLEKFQKSSDNLASISGAKDEVVTAKVDGIKALNDETARLTAQVANAIDGKVDMAENAATSAENFAETSKQWAIKMNDKVANEDYSAKYYAEKAQTAANLADIQSKITNCITEIPQDIKLELVDGTLTLKAGSKVYVPNGAGVFDEVVISSDLTNTTKAKDHLMVTVVNNALAPFSLSKCFSGRSAPTSPTGGTLWYDTVNNKMKIYTNSIWNERKDCLPIAIVTANGTSYTSIDQVFNGFGYIGSTVFALPGVKGLIPNGRNTDGSLKNIEFTTSKVLTSTMPSSNIAGAGLWLSDMYLNGIFVRYGNVGAPGYVTIDEENNLNLGTGGQFYAAYAGDLGLSTTGITSFTPKTAFHAVDYQDVPKLATDNTFTGANTFINYNAFWKTPYNVIIRSANIENGITPATNQYAGIEFRDKNDTRLAWIGIKQGTDGTQIVEFQKQGSTTAFRVPTPPASDNSTQIATTAWVKGRHQVVSALPASPDANTFYYIPED